MNLATICHSVIRHCQREDEADDKVRAAALELKEDGDLQQLPPNNPFKIFTPLFIKVMEVAFPNSDINDDDKRIKSYFKIGEHTAKVEYTEIAPILLDRCSKITRNEEELAFVTKFVSKIFSKAAEVLDGEYTGRNVVLILTPTKFAGGGCEDYGGFQSHYTQTISSFDEAYQVMASSALLQMREQTKSKI